MNSRRLLVAAVVIIAVLAGTAFAASKFHGYVEAVDSEKGTLSVQKGKEVIQFECAPEVLKKPDGKRGPVGKKDEVTVTYTEEEGKKKATRIFVHIAC